MAEEDDYVLDQDVGSSSTTSGEPVPSLNDLQKDPLFQKFMRKMSTCKNEQQKQNLLREIQEQISPRPPDTRTVKQKFDDRKKLLKNQRTRKSAKNNESVVKPPNPTTVFQNDSE